jgi:hypothetical protein
MIENDWTIRQIADDTGWCRATIHNDLSKFLPKIDKDLGDRVAEIIRQHKSVSARNGGLAIQRILRDIREKGLEDDEYSMTDLKWL